ncbi:MAG: EAL domain-containing protein [Thermodesulfobacteriota bacterium]
MPKDPNRDKRTAEDLLAEIDRLKKRVAELEAGEVARDAEQQRCRLDQEAVKYDLVWLELARAANSDHEHYVERLLSSDASALQIERVSYWAIAEDFGLLRCRKLYTLSTNRFSSDTVVLEADQFPAYKQALANHRSIVADKAQEHPHTREFTEFYLKPLGITSMLDVPVRLAGRMVGIVCHEHVGPSRVWSRLEQDFAQSVADLLGLSIEAEDRRKSQEKLNLAAKVIESSNEAIIITDRHGKIIDVNEAFCLQSGYSKEDLLDRTPGILQSGRHDRAFYRDMWKSLFETGQWQGEIWDRRKSGEIYPKLLSISAVRDERKEITQFVGFSSDISHMKHTEAQLQRLAHYDPLTGLANRLLFRDRLNMALAEGRRHGRNTALVLLDLDGFKTVNDSLGHLEGDQLLVLVADRLRESVREIDTVGRLGGDEFALVVPWLENTAYVSDICGRILASFLSPFNLEGREVFVATGIGVAFAPSDGEDVDTLLRNADIALYSAKDQGKNVARFFSQAMNVEMVAKTEVEIAIRSALAANDLNLYFQPIVECASGRVVAVEALLRWNEEQRGLITTETILNVAEERGLTAMLGDWILRRACEHGRSWLEKGLRPIRVAVNVSGRQLSLPSFAGRVQGILEATGLDPSLLELEITEHVVMRDLDAAVKTLGELKTQGIRVSLDAFGTGYSSLNRLRVLPVDALKIDKSFVADIGSYDANQPILTAMVSVAHSIDLEVVAEGIESPAQLGFLTSLGCDLWQGRLFSAAVPDGEIVAMLVEDRRALSFCFHWTTDLEVGNELIDAQHKLWFARLSELCRAILGRAPTEELRDKLRLLSDYSRLHFSDEEAMMLDSGYRGHQSQKQAHDEILGLIRRLAEAIPEHRTETAVLVAWVRALNDCFRSHIREMDRRLADHLRARRA